MSTRRVELNPLMRIKNAVLQGGNVLLPALQRGNGTPVVELDFPKGDVPSKFNKFP